MIRKTILAAFAAATLTFAGCNSESEAPQPAAPAPADQQSATDAPTEIYEYKLDNRIVKEGAYNLEDPGLHIAVTGKPSDDGNEIYVTIDAFSSDQLYIQWGDQHGHNVAGMLEFEKVMSQYAEASGTIKEYEATGNVNQEYLDFEAQEYERIFGKKPEAGQTGRVNSLAMLHKDYVGGSSWLMGSTSPFMMPGWNNRVSRYHPFYIYGVFIMYDRSFYRNRFFTLWSWGWQNIRMWGPFSYANDRMSSGFCF
ncbi:hypothetical protein AB9P05_05290 [Roseivirga sp. BDSF3-8]|uniref:hypothetical protein n=1 Tax=Roseivirga sp. BDSF3-8 TaxID=3241598 RepID=UPI0035322244